MPEFCRQSPTLLVAVANFPACAPKDGLLFTWQPDPFPALPRRRGDFSGSFFAQACGWFWVGRFYCILSSVYGMQYIDLENLLPCHSSSPESPKWSAFFFAPFKVFLCVYCVMYRVFCCERGIWEEGGYCILAEPEVPIIEYFHQYA